MLPGIIWYVAFAFTVVFYLIAAVLLTFYTLFTSDRRINLRFFGLQLAWLVSIGMCSIFTFQALRKIEFSFLLWDVFIAVIFTYFAVIAVTLFIRTKNDEKHPRDDTHSTSDRHSV